VQNHEKASIKIANMLIEIRNEYLANVTPKHYRFPNTLGGHNSKVLSRVFQNKVYSFENLYKFIQRAYTVL
jgi:hypothetical protein